MGGNNRKKLSNSKIRGPGASSPANCGLFVEGGLLSDWSPFNSPPSIGSRGNSRSGNVKGSNSDSKSGSASGLRSQFVKSTGNAIGYVYPEVNAYVDGGGSQESNMDGSNPVVLIDTGKTPIVAVLDEGPVKESQNVDYVYDYDSSFILDESSHRGLGFRDEEETNPDGIGSSKMEEKESGSVNSASSEEGETDFANAELGGETLEDEMSSPEENTGYVLIGGTKIYTQDITDEDDDDDEEESSDEESSDSSSGDDDGSSSSGSDIDDEVAADYFEGIGRDGNIINVDQLVGQSPDVSSEDSDSENRFNETLQKLGGIALQEASMEYGLPNPGSRIKYRAKSGKPKSSNYAWSSALDDLMLVKDSRTVSGRKKHVAKFPQSWPSEARKSKNFRKIPGEKKKHRKEMIAAKRLDRMIRRGVDLQKINLKLQQMVLDGVDMFSFQPMHTRDCSQVRKVASIYRLQSGCQGSGKKRFVTVIRTQHTCMPSSTDKIRLDKLIGLSNEDADFSVTGGKPINVDKNAAKKAARVGANTPIGFQSPRNKPNKNVANYSASKEARQNKRTGNVGSYSAQPLSFVSSGILTAEMVELGTIEASETKSTSHETKTMPSTLEYGAFEMHTTGFGSKMMAKMGYVEGSGLGKDGKGMAQPIEVFQRPKSLGLGAEVPETNGKPTNVQPRMKPIGRDVKSSGPSGKSTRKVINKLGAEVLETSGKRDANSIGRDAKSSGTSGKSTRKEINKLGSFEKHTKGFGSKMMAKMGFVEGTGLGKDSQGMVTPLVAVRRPKARGLGAER